MSFGQFSAARGRRPAPNSACVCGSGAVFSQCCGPVLDGMPAPTAEALMRSRYAAFALGDVAHLRDSWHPATRPDRLDAENDLTWERLAIDAVEAGSIDDTRGTVSFRASWRDTVTGERGVLAEVSRFRRVDGRWVYLDGAVDRRSV